MITISAFLQEIIYLYMIALIGFAVRKTGILNQHTNHILTQLILYVTLPALILYSLAIPFSYDLMHEFIWMLAMSGYILLISVIVAWIMRKYSRLIAHRKNVYEGLIIFGNQGFMGFAVVFAIFGEQGIIYLTMFNILYFILIWTYGIYLFTRQDVQIDWKWLYLNPGVLATWIGLFVLLLPISWPDILEKTLKSAGEMTIPLSMILIGSLIASIPFRDALTLLTNHYLWLAGFAKLLFIPLLLPAFKLISVPHSLLIIAVLTAGMPSAPTMSIYAQKFGGDTHFASVGVMLSSLLSVITIPILYTILELL